MRSRVQVGRYHQPNQVTEASSARLQPRRIELAAQIGNEGWRHVMPTAQIADVAAAQDGDDSAFAAWSKSILRRFLQLLG